MPNLRPIGPRSDQDIDVQRTKAAMQSDTAPKPYSHPVSRARPEVTGVSTIWIE